MEKKPIISIYKWATLLSILGFLGTTLTGAIIFGVDIQTKQYKAEIDKLKYEYELKITKIKEEQKKQLNALTEFEKSKVEFISETVFLRISKKYSDAIAQYQR